MNWFRRAFMLKRLFLIAGVALAMSNAANAVTITIGTDTGGGIVFAGSGSDSIVTAPFTNGSFSGSVTASGSPPNPSTELLDSTTLSISSTSGGTLDVWVTAQGILGPL